MPWDNYRLAGLLSLIIFLFIRYQLPKIVSRIDFPPFCYHQPKLSPRLLPPPRSLSQDNATMPRHYIFADFSLHAFYSSPRYYAPPTLMASRRLLTRYHQEASPAGKAQSPLIFIYHIQEEAPGGRIFAPRPAAFRRWILWFWYIGWYYYLIFKIFGFHGIFRRL